MIFLSTVRHPDVGKVRAAWERYVRDEELPPDTLRPYVLRAWDRARASGCNPRLGRADLLGEHETRQLLLQRQEVITATAPFLEALSRAAGADRHAAMLADPDGRLLRVVGDAETMGDENFPRPGSLLDEAHAGANGVGTSLAENGYVELVGPEHFIEGFQAFTCQGVPVTGPNGAVGVLSMSVRALATADRVRDILFCATEAVECDLLARWLSSTSGEGIEHALERLRQDMVQRLTTARLRMELAARRIATGADVTRTLQTSRTLSKQFARQAQTWRLLAFERTGPAQPEALELADIVQDLMDLLSTEARVVGVQFEWAAADRVRVLDDRQVLTRRLLGGFLSALQGAASGSTLVINVRTVAGLGRTALEEHFADGRVSRGPIVESVRAA
jgi:sigma-54 dependent transcriptional regulator, acetoin dehydrogenase operon transcriptional activator AcoR